MEKVNKAGAVFDLAKLEWMNGIYIREIDENRLVEFLTPFLNEAGIDIADKIKLLKIVQAIRPRINTASDVADAVKIFTSDELHIVQPDALEILKQETAKQVLETFLLKLEKMPVRDSIGFKDLMKEIQKETGLKGPFLWKPVRVAITGTESGPELPVVVDIFGKEKVKSFVKQAIENYI